MPWQNGNRGTRGTTSIRDSREEKQILETMKQLNVSPTPENKDKVYQAIAGQKRSNKEIAELVRTLFAG